jgi:WD40 repeat protein
MGHSSHVTKVKFTANDKYVISTGGNDKTVIVWETDFAMDDPHSYLHNEEEEEKDIDYGDDEAFFESKVDKAKIQKAEAKRAE